MGIEYFITKLWMWYAQRIMKWNFILISKNKEQTELISITFCDNGELTGRMQNMIDGFIKERGL